MYNPLETQEPVVLLNFNTFGKVVAENEGVMLAATRQHMCRVEGGAQFQGQANQRAFGEERELGWMDGMSRSSAF